jgi:hypothetical protein
MVAVPRWSALVPLMPDWLIALQIVATVILAVSFYLWNR